MDIYIYTYSSNKNVINANCLSFDNPFLTSKKDSKGFFWIFVKAYIIETESKIQPILYSSWPIRLQIVCTLAETVCIYVFFFVKTLTETSNLPYLSICRSTLLMLGKIVIREEVSLGAITRGCCNYTYPDPVPRQNLS